MVVVVVTVLVTSSYTVKSSATVVVGSSAVVVAVTVMTRKLVWEGNRKTREYSSKVSNSAFSFNRITFHKATDISEKSKLDTLCNDEPGPSRQPKRNDLQQLHRSNNDANEDQE